MQKVSSFYMMNNSLNQFGLNIFHFITHTENGLNKAKYDNALSNNWISLRPRFAQNQRLEEIGK